MMKGMDVIVTHRGQKGEKNVRDVKLSTVSATPADTMRNKKGQVLP